PNWLVDAVGGNMSKTTALGSRLFAAFAESGMLLLIENWGAGAHYIADNGDGTFRLPDLRNTFARAAAGAIDPDIANVRWIGSWQGDAIRNITGSYTPSGMNTSSTGRGFYGGSLSSEWSGALKQVNLSTTEYVLRGSDAKYQSARLDFDASLVVPTAWDNRPQNTAYYPRIHV
ncbi:MAG: hypothetical protein LBE62_12070, partial [Azonexus sp.]|nr:hypothetical protein [Azonexus sp.]